MNVLVHIRKQYLKPNGGAGAVCYYYNEEQIRRGASCLSFFDPKECDVSYKCKNNALYKKIENYKNAVRKRYFEPPVTGYDYSKYDIIHFHDTNSLYFAKNDLKDYKGIIVLQSHSPEPFALEQYAKMKWWQKILFPFSKMRFEKMDKFAFDRADYLIFPCQEAEEPYFKQLPYFEKIHKERPTCFKYVLTGIPPCTAKRKRKDVCNELNIPEDDFIITYVGRHNKIKGFDVLKSIARLILRNHSNIWFISAGKEEPIKRLNHSNWKEIGWTMDAHSYISASDVFILPNRETYFDIVMLEILSLGKIVVASDTGGNKFFKNQGCEGVFLFKTQEECVKIIETITTLSIEERGELGKKNREFFEKNLTVSSMYDNYISMLKSLKP